MVLQESFGNRLALISADEESVRTVVGGELKVTRLRDLDAEERVRFSSELSKEWKAVIENSRPILDEFDPEDLRPDTRGGTFCKVATAFGVGAVGAMAGHYKTGH
ncbi:hypothetical protein GNI_125220 [Gregarina niphandrodes]|uniref:Uncharacterized protein n=1 Tax=Gregarina niphandrodes TaxID=110365 RepID=A0A023B259_GRENI|nr:hypothetical protein GNI_125220 [Gregarina niphandrodes]EZG50740.1 hypothetical protein GNI_125220 [Gregarina niphandrodes]|eukprot:XP_011131988.1 hypothetical protein GNI_125220 [Gregarina niphandrodes]